LVEDFGINHHKISQIVRSGEIVCES